MSSVRRRRAKRSAFTLIELLLVLVILAVLASIVVLNFNGIFGKADKTKALADISQLETAIETYRVDVKDFPPTLDALVNNPGNTDWRGPYVKKGVPKDPWGHDYNYSPAGTHNTNGFDLWSNGDGKTPPDGLDNWSVPTSGNAK
jgi:general secretion pathway protein G